MGRKAICVVKKSRLEEAKEDVENGKYGSGIINIKKKGAAYKEGDRDGAILHITR